jgi:hypothetical protein
MRFFRASTVGATQLELLQASDLIALPGDLSDSQQ